MARRTENRFPSQWARIKHRVGRPRARLGGRLALASGSRIERVLQADHSIDPIRVDTLARRCGVISEETRRWTVAWPPPQYPLHSGDDRCGICAEILTSGTRVRDGVGANTQRSSLADAVVPPGNPGHNRLTEN